jgi:hypothetical protein
MTPPSLMLILIAGLIVGPFIFLNRLWDDDKILLMFVMIILFPVAILMGIKICLAEWFWAMIKY